MFSHYDIVINETHFGARLKCPDEFICTGRSDIISSKRPRGGVAVYKRLSYPYQLEIVTKLRDCVVVKIKNTDLIIAAIYIPPSDSLYFDDIYFINIELLIEHFKYNKLIIVGDLNSRCGNTRHLIPSINHIPNPDKIKNGNGKKIQRILQDDERLVMLNGLVSDQMVYDSNFTFYRGTLKSQVDIAFTNNLESVTSFKILDKTIYSDHCPVTLSCHFKHCFDLDLVNECAKGIFSYDNHDVNKRLKIPISWSRVDVVKAISHMEKEGTSIIANLNDVNLISSTS